MTDFERLLEFYSTRKKDFGLDLSEISLLLQFESYFEMKAANFFLVKLLATYEKAEGFLDDFYVYMLDDLREKTFGAAGVEFVQSEKDLRIAAMRQSKKKK